MKLGLAVIFSIALMVWCGARTVKWITFTQNCGGILKQSADASNLDLAAQKLQEALLYIEKENLTYGYTSVIYRTPDEDVGFWYKNLKTTLAELDTVRKANTTPLEKSNILMKLRETLLDNGKNGTTLTVPDGISVFPANGGWAFFGFLLFG
jgi:hypothetical protein